MTTPQVQPYLAHLYESHRFTSAIVFLIAADIHATVIKDSDLGKKHQKFVESLTGSYEEPRTYFLAQLFVGRIASFEVFLQETISMVVQKNPKKVGGAEFKLSDILDCTEVTQLVQRAAEEFLNKLMYKKPSEYLSSMCELLSIERAPLDADWLVFVEGKARRDLGMHNAWKCNAIYVRKLSEAGLPSQLKPGDSALPREDKYILEVDGALDRLAKGITKQVLVKHWPEVAEVYESTFDA
jgi:hypothetical protein